MKSKSIWISIIAVIISFIGGFILANAFNRNELDELRAENSRLKSAPEKSAQNQSELALTEEEIRQRIAEADQNPDDFTYQKNLGLALYRYAAMKQDANLLTQIEKILRRANRLNDKDYDVIIALGNLQFDLGYIKKNNENFAAAREFYATALGQNANDVNVRTDLALTYFLQNPPDNARAVEEFKKSLQINPKHEKSLLFIAQALLQIGDKTGAESYLGKLKEVNANAPTLDELQTQTAQNLSGAQK